MQGISEKITHAPTITIPNKRRTWKLAHQINLKQPTLEKVRVVPELLQEGDELQEEIEKITHIIGAIEKEYNPEKQGVLYRQALKKAVEQRRQNDFDKSWHLRVTSPVASK